MSARQIIETRLGRPLGPLVDMPLDLRRNAIYLLSRQILKPRTDREKLGLAPSRKPRLP